MDNITKLRQDKDQLEAKISREENKLAHETYDGVPEKLAMGLRAWNKQDDIVVNFVKSKREEAESWTKKIPKGLFGAETTTKLNDNDTVPLTKAQYLEIIKTVDRYNDSQYDNASQLMCTFFTGTKVADILQQQVRSVPNPYDLDASTDPVPENITKLVEELKKNLTEDMKLAMQKFQNEAKQAKQAKQAKKIVGDDSTSRSTSHTSPSTSASSSLQFSSTTAPESWEDPELDARFKALTDPVIPGGKRKREQKKKKGTTRNYCSCYHTLCVSGQCKCNGKCTSKCGCGGSGCLRGSKNKNKKSKR